VVVVRGRVAVGNQSCTSPIKQLVKLVRFGRAWSGNFGDQDDLVDLIRCIRSIDFRDFLIIEYFLYVS